MKVPPLLFTDSFAASEADVDDAGYSPPTPKPVIPLATVSIQNIPAVVVPCAAVAKIEPITIKEVVAIIAHLRPR
ncbi:unnamed protein product [[Candida] boidinii]|nr:unnamed protein product [[Candida] boidinii]